MLFLQTMNNEQMAIKYSVTCTLNPTFNLAINHSVFILSSHPYNEISCLRVSLPFSLNYWSYYKRSFIIYLFVSERNQIANDVVNTQWYWWHRNTFYYYIVVFSPCVNHNSPIFRHSLSTNLLDSVDFDGIDGLADIWKLRSKEG